MSAIGSRFFVSHERLDLVGRLANEQGGFAVAVLAGPAPEGGVQHRYSGLTRQLGRRVGSDEVVHTVDDFATADRGGRARDRTATGRRLLRRCRGLGRVLAVGEFGWAGGEDGGEVLDGGEEGDG